MKGGMRLALGTFLAGLLSTLSAAVALRLDPKYLGVPWGRGDAVFYYMLASTMRRFGWFTYNPDVGFPYSMDLAHFPMPEIRSWLVLWAVTRVVENPVVALNLVFVLGFFAVGAASYLLFHATTRRAGLSMLFAVSAATLPWHFGRFRHVLLADYSAVPVALLLTYWLWSNWWDKSTGRQVLAVMAAIYVGTGGLYYSFFALLGIGPLLLWKSVRNRRALSLVMVDVAIVATIPATLAILVWAQRALAREALVAEILRRGTGESLLFAGDPRSLFAPWPFFDGYAESWAHTNVLASLAVAIALCAAFLAQVGRIRTIPMPQALQDPEIRRWSMLMLWLVIWWLPGLGYVFAIVVTPVVRSWGRLSLSIIYVAMVILGLLLVRLAVARPTLMTPLVVAVGVLVAAQVAADHRKLMPTWSEEFVTSAAQYSDQVREALPAGCAIIQLPVMDNPEDWRAGSPMGAYDHFWMPLYLPEYRWSFGVVRGSESWRRAQWTYLGEPDLEALFRQARRDGACAVHIDEAGLTPAERDELARVLGERIAEEGRWSLYRLPIA